MKNILYTALMRGWIEAFKIVSGLPFLAVMKTSPLPSLHHTKIVENGPVMNEAADELITTVRKESRTQTFVTEQAQMEQSRLAQAAYASLRLEEHYIDIAESSGEDLNCYTNLIHSDDVADEVLNWFEQSAEQRNLHYIATGLPEDARLADVYARLWLEKDIVPFHIYNKELNLQPTLVEQTSKISGNFDTQNIARTQLSGHNEVEVADLVTLENYRQQSAPTDFALLLQLAQSFQGKRLVFISATPQGGGVALMRHALIRLLRLLQVDAHWHILQAKKEAFDITKTKFHNVLQNVASQETRLTDEDKLLYDSWMRDNAELLQREFGQADVVVIDDPQPAGLIPYIKEANPAAKIIYRSHIQIEGSLADQPGTPQHATWEFLWEKIQHADYFVSHPMPMFIPANVPAGKIFYMPATTDPLDGLNKPLSEPQLDRYMALFNMLLLQAHQTPLDPQRQYLIQIARFDPSKGIPDVLEAYRKLREMLEAEKQAVPQLVIGGNSSIDDPDGMRIYDLTRFLLTSEPYARFADDVKVLRIPHRDQILNALLRRSRVVLQLSIREGFEIKVTEALLKGKPVVAYRVGGIPLQIEDSTTGFLVEIGDTTQVAQRLYELFTEPQVYRRMSEAAKEHVRRDYLTVPNAICWLYLAQQLTQNEPIEGHHQWVKALVQRQHASRQRTGTS